MEQAALVISRIVERMEALGVSALADYPWPEGYTQADFVELYTLLGELSNLLVADDTRDAIYKLVSSIQ